MGAWEEKRMFNGAVKYFKRIKYFMIKEADDYSNGKVFKSEAEENEA